MDARTFDRLAKSVSSAASRRGLVQVLAGLPLGLVMFSQFGRDPDATTGDEALAKSHRRHRRKARHRHNPGKNKRKRKHKSKSCSPSSLTRCGGQCVDTQTDSNHCGTCGTACLGVPNGTPVCIDGTCDLECAFAADPCGGACCAQDQFCQADACQACLAPGEVCTSDAQCCNGDCHTYSGFCFI